MTDVCDGNAKVQVHSCQTGQCYKQYYTNAINTINKPELYLKCNFSVAAPLLVSPSFLHDSSEQNLMQVCAVNAIFLTHQSVSQQILLR